MSAGSGAEHVMRKAMGILPFAVEYIVPIVGFLLLCTANLKIRFAIVAIILDVSIRCTYGMAQTRRINKMRLKKDA